MSAAMLPRKTEQARTALQAHRAPLDMRQRRLLILCDGQRDINALTSLVGPEAPTMVIQLIQAGYLVTGLPAQETTAGPVPATVATPPAPEAAATTSRRRSMAAARIYLLGILEMQRHPHAAALLHGLQRARSDEDVLAAMHAALHALPALTSAGYSERVRERVLEVLPLEHIKKGTEGIKSHQAEPETT